MIIDHQPIANIKKLLNNQFSPITPNYSLIDRSKRLKIKVARKTKNIYIANKDKKKE